MKRHLIRFIASVEVLILVMTFCISVSASTPEVKRNTGERHEVCETLSVSAEAYYRDHSYEMLSEQPSAVLLSTLRMLMKTTHEYKSEYDDCRDEAYRVDSTGEDGKISLVYTSGESTRANFGGSTGNWNREHVWPKSLGGFGNSGAGADLHHIRPSDLTINSTRGNLKFGNVDGGKNATGSSLVGGASGGTYNSVYFEPLDNAKGDVARICLYVYARYGKELVKCNDITNVFESVDVLLEWCMLDPVDEWEMGRNDIVGDIQGNRNVFIDYPEYAWLIFDREVPEDMQTPSKAAREGTGAETPEAPETPETPEVPGTSETPDTLLPEEVTDLLNNNAFKVVAACGVTAIVVGIITCAVIIERKRR